MYIEIGKEKEYNINGKLKFEGYYLKGKRNGKVIEYYNNENKKFKGEYFKGKKWNGKYFNYKGNFEYEIKVGNGNGKEYDDNGKLIFEGEYLNDNRHDKEKEYYNNNNIKFEGEYIIGKRLNGKGYDENYNIAYELKNVKVIIKEYENWWLIFEGEYLNGKKNGLGKEYDYYVGLIFKGEYLNDKRHGKGKEYKYVKLIWKNL